MANLRAAYQGHVRLAFKQFVPSDADVWGSSVLAVRDARERFRKQNSSDLAQVLATLTYSKKTRPHGHVYAAWGPLDCRQTINCLRTSTVNP